MGSVPGTLFTCCQRTCNKDMNALNAFPDLDRCDATSHRVYHVYSRLRSRDISIFTDTRVDAISFSQIFSTVSIAAAWVALKERAEIPQVM